MIEAESLSASFDGRRVVDSVSFKAQPSTVVAFLGPNGAGKSTTMRMLTGYLAPDSGTAKIQGVDVRSERIKAQRLIGYLPEAANGFARLSVKEFLVFAGESRGLRATALDGAIDRVCEQFSLSDTHSGKLGELSKGWRQRVWFAQALIHDPPVLILDEPTDGLDPNQKREVHHLIRQLVKDKTILLSTHILEEAEELADRAVIIAEGQIIADESMDRFVDSHGRMADKFHALTTATSADDRGSGT